MVSLAACTAMDVISIAAKKRQQIAATGSRSRPTQRDEYPQVLTRVDVTHEVEGPLVEEAAIRRAIELSATKYCPVNAMLSAGATEVHHGYSSATPAPRPSRPRARSSSPAPTGDPDIVP